MHTIKTVLKHVKSTKGTHVFATDDPAAGIKQLYVQKEAMAANPPASIIVTIEEGDHISD